MLLKNFVKSIDLRTYYACWKITTKNSSTSFLQVLFHEVRSITMQSLFESAKIMETEHNFITSYHERHKNSHFCWK